MDTFDYNSDDEDSYLIPSLDNDGNEHVRQDCPAMNSTLVHRSDEGDAMVTPSLVERLGNLEKALNKGNLISTADLGNQISAGISTSIGSVLKQTMGASDKRSRIPSEAPEKPVVVAINVEGLDDNHKVFCWEMRGLYKNPNADPKSHWAEAKYPAKVSPNLRGNVYLTHLMPLSMSSKALGWLHNHRHALSIKYFIHSNRSGKRPKKEGITIASGTDELGTTNYSVEEHWENASSIKETLDGLWNLTAAMFQVRPWDWTPLVIGRFLHECGFFVGCSNNREQQKRIVTEFIDECLFSTQTRLGQDTPPLTYKEAVVIAQEVVGNATGRTTEMFRRKCIYGSRFDLQTKDAEIADLRKQLANARAEIASLKAVNRNQSGYSNANRGVGIGGRGLGRGGRNAGRDKYLAGSDPKYEEKRSKVCRKFNIGTCKDDQNCDLLHNCNKRIAVGEMCGHNHPSKDHL